LTEIGIGEFARRSRLSIKALRLYDELGVLPPSRVEATSGYRYYDDTQLENARRIAILRQVDFPLALIKEVLECDPFDAAGRIEVHWRASEQVHEGRRELVASLVNQLNGRRKEMNEVNTREIPERNLLCLKRNVDEQGAWNFGKEFMEILRERPMPKLEGRTGAVFCIFWGEVSADSDGPVEWCKPVPHADAMALAEVNPELILRVEPAHREAFVAIAAQADAVQWQLASEALRGWADDQGSEMGLTIKPEDLGLRITYLWTQPTSQTSSPDCDFAVPFA
jgi:DNA-binding transcriptional MerR regulator